MNNEDEARSLLPPIPKNVDPRWSSGIIKKACIHCGIREADSEEHLLPESLGYFGRFFRRNDIICKPCNESIGNRIYNPLFHNGYYALARTIVPFAIGKQNLRPGRTSSKPYRPRVKGKDGIEWYYESDPGGKTGRRDEQIVFKKPDGTSVSWLLPEGLDSAESLRRAHFRSPHREHKPIFFISHRPETIATWIKDVFGSDSYIEPSDEPTRVEFVEKFTLKESASQAMAVVALHTFMGMFTASGHERGFLNLKRFIREGGAPFPVSTNATSEEPFGIESRIDDRCHDSVKHIIVYDAGGKTKGPHAAIQLFRNNTQKTPWWIVTLDTNKSQLQIPLAIALVFNRNGRVLVRDEQVDGHVYQMLPKDEKLVLDPDSKPIYG